jgi:hypothetical protein
VSICDAALCQVVRGKLNVNPITHQNADPIPAHSTGNGREHHVIGIVYLDLEICVRLLINDYTSHFDQFFFHLHPFSTFLPMKDTRRPLIRTISHTVCRNFFGPQSVYYVAFADQIPKEKSGNENTFYRRSDGSLRDRNSRSGY